MSDYKSIEERKLVLHALGSESQVQWLDKHAALIMHDELISIYGGSNGLRDEKLLLSALGAGLHIETYQADAEIPEMAAAIFYSLVRNHPFTDGNKRTGLVIFLAMLEINNYALLADDIELIGITRSLAAGEIDKDELSVWALRSTSPSNELDNQSNQKTR